LTISSKLVQMMGGQLQLESQPGTGSRFYFTIPFSRVPRQNGKPPVPDPFTKLDGLRVLVVDDNATNRQILLHALARWGIDAVEADSGESALTSLRDAVAEKVPFQLILLDVCMPGMDGFTLLEHIRRDPDLDRPAILMLSSLDRGKDIARARELGAAAYVVKPALSNKLRAAIGQALAIVGDAPAKSEPPVPRDAQPETPGRRLRILVAEDNPVNQLFALRTLERAGHEAIVAGNGEAALELLESSHFDVVLMDVQMPIMDGYQATARIRESERGTDRHQPVIAMTAHAMTGDREHCLKMGMDHYVSKPIQARLLFKAIAEVLAPNDSEMSIVPEPGASRDTPILKEDTMPLDPEFLRELSQMFLEDCPRLMTHIREAIDTRNASDLKLAAHTLKGSAGVFKDQPAFDAALRMEHIGKESDWDHAEAAWQVVNVEMARLSATLISGIHEEV
jgi:CheY-like chemotaxis protein